MEVMEIVSNLDYLFDILVPGVIFLYVYDVLAIKKYPLQFYIVVGCVVGTVIKSVVEFLNSFFIKFWCLPIPMLFAYIALAIFSAVSFYLMKNDLRVRKLFKKALHIETGDNFWTCFLDTKKRNNVVLHLNNGKVLFGVVCSADNEFIVLTNHCLANSDSEDDIQKAFSHVFDRSIYCVPTKNVTSMELYYEDGSKMNQFVFGAPK